MGMQNGVETLEHGLAVSCKTEAIRTTRSSSKGAPWYLHKKVETWCPYKNLHTL